MSSEPIRELHTIAKLLNRLIKERQSLTVWRLDTDTSHGSLLVGIKHGQGIYLDAPPSSLNDEYRRGDRLLVRTLLDLQQQAIQTRRGH